MAEYMAIVQFQPIATANAEDEHMAILPPAGVSVFIKRIRFGTGSTQGDQSMRIRVRRTSAAGTAGTVSTATIIKMRDDSPASVCGVLAKTGSGTRTPGANVDLLLDCGFIHRAGFEWVARDWKDYLESGVNQRIIITLTVLATNASNNFLEVWWSE